MTDEIVTKSVTCDLRDLTFRRIYSFARVLPPKVCCLLTADAEVAALIWAASLGGAQRHLWVSTSAALASAAEEEFVACAGGSGREKGITSPEVLQHRAIFRNSGFGVVKCTLVLLSKMH